MPDAIPAEEQAPAVCPEHGQPVKWHCGLCGKPICPACQPIGWNFQVYHKPCLPKAQRAEEEKEKASHPLDAPTLGVRFSAWYLVVKGLIFFSIFLLLIGLALFSQSLPMRALMTTPLAAGLDTVPGGRMFLAWGGAACLVFSLVWFILGIGLLNCLALARNLLLVISWLDVILAGLVWLVILFSGHGLWLVPVSSILFLGYFLRKDVKSQFH
jgi:hypothetical protein